MGKYTSDIYTPTKKSNKTPMAQRVLDQQNAEALKNAVPAGAPPPPPPPPNNGGILNTYGNDGIATAGNGQFTNLSGNTSGLTENVDQLGYNKPTGENIFNSAAWREANPHLIDGSGNAMRQKDYDKAQATQQDTTPSYGQNTGYSIEGAPNGGGYTPQDISLGAEDTIEARVQRIIDGNSAGILSEQTRAKQQANTKGLLNTSMAVGDAERARYDYALPIAGAGAEQQLAVLRANQDARNTYNLQKLSDQNAYDRQLLTGQQSLDQLGAAGDIQQSRDYLLQGFGLTNKDIDAMNEQERDERLAGLQADRDATLQGYGLTTQEIANMNDTEKDYRLNDFQADRDQRLQNFGLTNQEIQSMTQAERDARLNGFQEDRDAKLQEYGMTAQELANLTQEERDNRLNQFDIQKDERANTQAFLMENLSQEGRVVITRIQGEYQKILNESTNAANIYASYSQQVADILSNPKGSPAAKQGLVDQSLILMENALALQNGIINTSIDFLNFD